MDYYVQEKSSAISIWKALLKKWFIILIVFAIGIGGAVTYSLLKIRNVYTASTSVVLKLALNDEIESNDNTNNATLAKRNLPTVKECLLSTKGANAANAYYNSENSANGVNVRVGAISVNYGETSMKFTLAYTDASEEFAKAKLEAVIMTAPTILAENIKAASIDLVPVQNEYDVSVSNKTTMTIIIGGVAGLAIGVGIAVLLYVLDNKIRSKEDIERLTGVSVIAYINNDIK